jgi:hypothetical protein
VSDTEPDELLDALDVLDEDEFAPVFCATDAELPVLADGALDDADDPPPHPVNIPAAIKQPAMTGVHERTLVLLIGTPRNKSPFKMRLVRRKTSRQTAAGMTFAGNRRAHGHTRPSPSRDRSICDPGNPAVVGP